MAMPALEVQPRTAAGGLPPTATGDRIFQLDVLRGWAILGILAVNAIAFAWPFQVMMSEAPPPGATSQADLIGVWVTDVFFHDKFRTLFTMLFGVSIFLVGGEKSDEARGALLWRRLLWLGLFKSGYLHGRAPLWTYFLIILVGGANLAAFAVWGWQDTMAGEADPTKGLAAAAGGAAFLITLFYASILILLVRFGLRPLVAWLAPVGRMAFTNYLTQTLIMVTLYYAPWGPMWFGQQGPAEMWMVVGAIWAAQIIWSPLWLSVFTMGPLEWIWRCLTYGRMVPIRP